MVFSSPEFLFLFLPLILLIYYLADWPIKNGFLLLASLFFYAWGEGYLVLLMICSIMINYLGGIAIDRAQHRPKFLQHLVLGIFVLVNLSFLVYFKYLNFFVDNLQTVGLFSRTVLSDILLPIGISFFTFQSISYLIDVYRQDAEVQLNPMNLGLYIALFPQLIAGPIVRYHDVSKQINSRTHSTSLFSRGVIRFIRGFVKKMVIANPMAQLADTTFNAPAEELTLLSAWIGILAYSLQIYFDFSGYSDMAIGLGRMFGFRFLENFQWPYISRSIQEFWRRWHISLSSWFRDYLYIPLGGNRKGAVRTYLNLFIVFLATGFWHGAAWTFIIWGLYHGAFLVVERLGFNQTLKRLPRAVSHLYLLLVVVIGWVFFRAEDLHHALTYLGSMVGLGAGTDRSVYYFFSNYVLLVFVAGLILATPLRRMFLFGYYRWVRNGAMQQRAWKLMVLNVGRFVIIMALFLWAISELAQNSYNPFIYFRF